MLKVSNISVLYGEIHAIWDASIEVDEGEIISIIGSNGAGKTTLLKAISGLVKPSSGSIEFRGEKLNGLSPHKICERGVVQVPEGRKIFPLMKVSENLEMGAYLLGPRKEVASSLNMVYRVFPILKERQDQVAGTLSGGEQQMLAMARGLMTKPELLMLDEPTLGLAPKAAAHILETLGQLHQEGITILLVSQEAIKSLEMAQRAYVLENGRISLEGTGDELLRNEDVKKSYLGL